MSTQEPQEPKTPTYYGRERVPASFKEILKNADKAIQSNIESLKKNPEMETVKNVFPDALQWIEANKEKALYAAFICFTVYDTADLIKTAYIKEQSGKPSLFDFTEINHGKSKLSDFLSHVREKDNKLYYHYNIRATRPDSFPEPTDKLNAIIWNREKEPASGKFEITAITGSKPKKKRGRKKEPADITPSVFFSIDFTTVESDFPFVKRLTEFDKRVCCAVCSILDMGQWVMSFDEIARAMGYTGPLNKKTRDKIHGSINKMSARARIDNSNEIAAGMDYPPISLEFDFIYSEIINGWATINGKDIKDPVHILQYPRIMQFAKDRKQVQQVPMTAIQSGKYKTDDNLAIEDYLLLRICNAKQERQKAKILYTTMYKNLNIEGKTERQRMRATAKDYMTHYQKTGWINSFEMQKDGITFTFEGG